MKFVPGKALPNYPLIANCPLLASLECVACLSLRRICHASPPFGPNPQPNAKQREAAKTIAPAIEQSSHRAKKKRVHARKRMHSLAAKHEQEIKEKQQAQQDLENAL